MVHYYNFLERTKLRIIILIKTFIAFIRGKEDGIHWCFGLSLKYDLMNFSYLRVISKCLYCGEVFKTRFHK